MRSLIILIVVFVLIAARRIGKFRIEMWQAMTFGALLTILFHEISIKESFYAINFDVIFFLFFMFIVGAGLELSGSLEYIAYITFRHAKNIDLLIIEMIFFFGVLSSIFTNDTIAIIGTSLALILSRNLKISPRLTLLLTAFSVTIGSTLTPIGNPQNLVITELTNLPNPFITFFKFNFVPMVLNSLIVFFVLKLFFREEFKEEKINHEEVEIVDKELSKNALISSVVIVFLIIVKIVLASIKPSLNFPMMIIAFFGAIPMLFSKRRVEILKSVDFKTILFFISMFILMKSVWINGSIQRVIGNFDIAKMDILGILLSSVVISQFISNVPMVTLFLPALKNAHLTYLMALASGSTIAGNLTILGAASNVIIVQKSENLGHRITFWEFFKVGSVITLLNIFVYYLFFKLI